MTFAVMFALLLGHATAPPSASAGACPPMPVRRIRPTGYDPEWRGAPDKWCTGIACVNVEVVVTVNPDGTVKSAVERGSWGDETDHAVVKAALNSKYIPATTNCKPVEGIYIFRELLTRID